MPQEDRRILFDNDEVYKALFTFCAQKQVKQPPPGHIVKIAPNDNNGGDFRFEIQNPLNGHHVSMEFGQDFLAAALMVFCRGVGIPLPKKARKTVLLNEGQIILRVQI